MSVATATGQEHSPGPQADGPTSKTARVKERAKAAYDRMPVSSRVRGARNYVDRHYDQMDTFNRLVVGGVVLIVGILVYNEVYDAIPTNNAAISQSNVSDTVETAFELAPIGLLVLVAGFILANVMGFTGGRR